MEPQVNRPHHKAKSTDKKKHAGGTNPKAFAYANPGRLQKQASRSHDIKEKRFHVPVVDRLPEEAPPVIVAVVGPPGLSKADQTRRQVGKTTLVKSLIKRYTKHSLSAPTGPLTVVASKRRRLTFLECPADSLASMVDVSKIADIVLLMIDGNYGFEMETMEFLNVLASSGMPGNVFGILTHLDLFKKPSTLQQAKKTLKHRFWSELYQGAKLFYLSGVINGRYPDREVHNISRFISVMKNPRPLTWRNAHPYCLADRFLDVTPPTAMEKDAKCDRTVALYGYLRGTNFPAQGARVHVPGAGDYTVSMIEALPDPCPTPFMEQAVAKRTGKSGRRRLGEKQKVLFAPMSDVGGVLVDRDAVYIDIKTANFDGNEDDDEERGFGEKMVVGLQGERRLLGEADEGVRLFSQGGKFNSVEDRPDVEDTGRKSTRQVKLIDQGQGSGLGSLSEDFDDEGFVSDELATQDGSTSGDDDSINAQRDFLHTERTSVDPAHSPEDLDFAESDSDMGSHSSLEGRPLDDDSQAGEEGEDYLDVDGSLRWKEKLAEHAQSRVTERPFLRVVDLTRMLYESSLSPTDIVGRWRPTSQHQENLEKAPVASSGEEEFFRKAAHQAQDDDINDRLIPAYDYDALEEKWTGRVNSERLRRRFTSKGGLDAKNADQETAESGTDADSGSEGDGDFEDLETGEKHTGNSSHAGEPDSLEIERERNARRKEELKARFEEEDREGLNNDRTDQRAMGQDRGSEQFGEDDWYDAQKSRLQQQLSVNRAEFDALDEKSRALTEGHKAGTYARIVLESVPYEFVARFNPRFPILVGGISATEDRFGFVQVRIKRHRWHKKILKTNDPLIFSLGWRRFQTLPIYSISDSRTRNRMLKYTPEHMHCFATFYGPLIAPNTGFSCVQSFSNSNPNFRIAATGVVLNVDEGTEIVKKLKLTGVPYKIFRNTAFIRDMFSSALEIAKFEGASVRTVSGVRGQIKRALSKPEGHFRATFEDKVLMSDIVFLRAWYPIRPHRFYNPVTNLLDAVAAPESDDPHGWQGMRLTGQIRKDEGLDTPQQKNSKYRPVERPTRHFNPMRVPRRLAADLPFKSQIVSTKAQREPTYMQKRAVVLGGEERRARDLMQKLMTLRNEKVAKRRDAQEERRKGYRKKMAENAEKKEEREKKERDEYWRKEGKKRRNMGDADNGPRKKRK
ncbi:MAG: Glycoside hydrolase 2 (Mannanase, beta-galactosidase) [Piccolia ochrophora]|nr:MAG: Glycoside hydrolase 2 (Mannanase, beta-galactosidase) [Piccolia ochrophora]